jgi:hypothetical protein
MEKSPYQRILERIFRVGMISGYLGDGSKYFSCISLAQLAEC